MAALQLYRCKWTRCGKYYLQRHSLRRHICRDHLFTNQQQQQGSRMRMPSMTTTTQLAESIGSDPSPFIEVCQCDASVQHFLDSHQPLNIDPTSIIPTSTQPLVSSSARLTLPIANASRNAHARPNLNNQLGGNTQQQQQAPRTSHHHHHRYSYSKQKTPAGNDLIIYNNQSFSHHKTNVNGESVFKCSKRMVLKCTARLHMRGERIIRVDDNHNHPIGGIVQQVPSPSSSSTTSRPHTNTLTGAWKGSRRFRFIKSDAGVNWIHNYDGHDFRQSHFRKTDGKSRFICTKTSRGCEACFWVLATGEIIEENLEHQHGTRSEEQSDEPMEEMSSATVRRIAASITTTSSSHHQQANLTPSHLQITTTTPSLASLCLKELVRQLKTSIGSNDSSSNGAIQMQQFKKKDFSWKETLKVGCHIFKCAKEENCEFSLLLHENEIVKLIGAHNHSEMASTEEPNTVVVSNVDLPPDYQTNIDVSSNEPSVTSRQMQNSPDERNSIERSYERTAYSSEEMSAETEDDNTEMENSSDEFETNSVVESAITSAAAQTVVNNNKVTVYLCESCPEYFATVGELKQHVLVEHYQVKPYKCAWLNCAHKDASLSLMRAHIVASHPLKYLLSTDDLMDLAPPNPVYSKFEQYLFPPDYVFKTKKLKRLHAGDPQSCSSVATTSIVVVVDKASRAEKKFKDLYPSVQTDIEVIDVSDDD